MGWASHYIKKLQAGETVSFRPRGNSMVPRIKSGQLVTVTPTPHDEIEAGDIVLCKVSGAEYLHLVVAVLSRGRRDEGEQLVFVIGNNRGRINGRTSNVYGKVTRIE